MHVTLIMREKLFFKRETVRENPYGIYFILIEKPAVFLADSKMGSFLGRKEMRKTIFRPGLLAKYNFAS